MKQTLSDSAESKFDCHAVDCRPRQSDTFLRSENTLYITPMYDIVILRKFFTSLIVKMKYILTNSAVLHDMRRNIFL